MFDPSQLSCRIPENAPHCDAPEEHYIITGVSILGFLYKLFIPLQIGTAIGAVLTSKAVTIDLARAYTFRTGFASARGIWLAMMS